jgi:hypothetical protein
MNKLTSTFALVRNVIRPSWIGALGLILLCLFVGALMPIYVALMNGQAGRVVAFPAALIFTLLLLYDRKLTLLLIILTRASGDYFLTLTKFALAGMQIGVGGLINAMVIMIAILLIFEKPNEVPRKNYLMWAPFLIIALFGVMISPDKSGAIRSWLGQLSSFAMFVSAFHFVHNKDDFNRCLRIVLWSAMLPIAIGLFDLATHRATTVIDEPSEGFRVSSTFGHPNEFAFYLSLIIGLTFYKMKTLTGKDSFRNGIVLWCYLMLLFFMLVLTKTRSAWISTLLGFILYAVFFERRYLLYIFVLGVIALFIPGVADRLSDLGAGNQVVTYAKLNSFAWRVYLWQSGLNWMTPQHYLFGYGFTAFHFYAPTFFPLANNINWDAHSAYVQLIFELGGIGLLSYAWIYYNVMLQLVWLLKWDRMTSFFVIVVVLNYLICSASDNMLDYLSFNWYMWFTAGMACAYVRGFPTVAPARRNPVPPISGSVGMLRPVGRAAVDHAPRASSFKGKSPE